MSLGDCEEGIGMYSTMVASGAITGGYTNSTLQGFCWTRMYEDLGAQA